MKTIQKKVYLTNRNSNRKGYILQERNPKTMALVRETLYSYDTVIAVMEKGKITLDSKYWDFSTTTGRHRNEFLCEGIEETRAKIKNGTYKLKEFEQPLRVY